MIVICADCGKEIERKPNEIAKNKSGLYFCDMKVCGKHYHSTHHTGAGRKIQRGYHRPEKGGVPA